MADRDHEAPMPTTNQPLNAKRRSTAGPLVATLLLLALIAVIFLVIFVLR